MNASNMSSWKKKSFTLIEMLIVIVIIGILAAALVPRLISLQSRTRNAARKVDLMQIYNGVATYYNFYDFVPTDLPLLLSGSLSSIPTDPLMASQDPCTGINALGTYLPTGAYSGGAGYNIAYNGFLYGRNPNAGYNWGWLAARMENDGTVNSYTLNNASFRGCAFVSNDWTPGAQVNYFNIIKGVVDSGMDSKGYLYFLIFKPQG